MARAYIDPGSPGPIATPMPGDEDDGFGLPPGLDTETDSGWDDGFDLGEPTDLGGTPDGQPGEQPWWVRLGIGLMLALLVPVAAAILPPSKPARAEAQLGAPIPVGSLPEGIAVNPVTNRVYVATFGKNTVTVIDGATNTIAAKPIGVGPRPFGIAVNPTTNRVYVTLLGSESVVVIDGATNTAIGTPIPVGHDPEGIAVNPVTNRVYVANAGDGTVTVIDGATNAVVGTPIPVTDSPVSVAVNPSTNRIYTANFNPLTNRGTVSVIDGTANTVVGSPIVVGRDPFSIVLNPATNRVYVASGIDDNVSVIDGASDTVIGSLFPIPGGIGNLAIDPSTNRIFVVALQGNAVTVIEGSFNSVIGVPITVGSAAEGIGVNPVTGRIYVGTQDNPGVTVIGVPLSIAPSTASPGTAITTTWSSLFAPDHRDFMGYFEPGAPNTSPLTQSFTNGRFIGGPGFPEGSIDLAIPSGLVSGQTYEVRFVSGFSGGTLALIVVAPPPTIDDTYDANSGIALAIPAPGVLANDTAGDPSLLRATVVTGPAHGTLALQPNGGFSYTAAAGFVGKDSFVYRAASQLGVSKTATVTLRVTAAVSDCAPRPPVKVVQAVVGGKLQVHVQATALNTQQANPVRTVRFGALQNAKVTLNGQATASGQILTVPAGSSAIDFTVERATPGQPTTVPFTVTDGCGDWPTFVGGGTGAGF